MMVPCNKIRCVRGRFQVALALKAKKKGYTSEWAKHERRVVNEFFPNEPI
jgi:hypothetical protein